MAGADNPEDYSIVAGPDVNATDKIATIRQNENGVVVPIRVNNNNIVQGDRILRIEIVEILP